MNSKTSEKYIKFNWESLVYWIAVVILFTLVLIFCFYRLGESTISDWDEARHGVNAYEMMQNREWIVTTYKGNPDYWNLKPPLSEWIICAFFSIFGYTRTVFRIYSAVSMFLCAGILFIWSYKRIGRIGACFALLALLAIHPLWLNHCARTGDADSLFILLCTISTLCLAEACAGRAAFMIVSCFSISLAFLTKSFHAMILIMELGVALCILRKSIRMTRSIIWLSLLALILPTGLWAFLRYQKDGLTFLSEMFLTDVLNRSMTAMEDHGGGLMSYFELLLEDYGFIACLTTVPIGLILNRKVSSNQIVLASAIIIPLIVFSLAKTKLLWYIYPALPPLVLFAAGGIQKATDSKQTRIIKCIALCIPVFLAVLSIYHCAYNILFSPMSVDAAQSAMEMCLCRSDETSSHVVYLDLSDDNPESWSQSDCLTIQLAGDCKPGDGTLEDWKKNEDALLFTMQDRPSASNGTMIRSVGEYCLISH